MKKLGLILILSLVLGSMVFIQTAQAADVRVIGTPNYVVFLKDDGSLEYYEVVNSVGYYIGFTPPGWRNDRLGRQVVHVSTRPDGARAELWHLSADTYYVDLYRAGGGFLGTGSFSAAGIPGGQGNVASGAGSSSPNASTAAQTTVTTQITTNSTSSVSAVTSVHISPSGSGNVYVVAAGDTLNKIARRYGVSLVALMNANHIANPNLIYAGQRLIIP